MRWKKLTSEQKIAAKKVRDSQWRRIFAWWPKWDKHSQTKYWLEHVWVRGHGAWWEQAKHYHHYEYRPGTEHCPDVKQPPPERCKATTCASASPGHLCPHGHDNTDDCPQCCH